MKLAVAVLSSILLACSVTTASPVNPSAAKNTGASTSADTSSTNGIGIDNLSPIPDEIKYLLKKHILIQDARNQQEKMYGPLKSRYDSRYQVLMGVKKDLENLKSEAQKGNGNPKYGKTEKTKPDLEAQDSKFGKLRKSLDDCQSEITRLVEKEWENDKRIVSFVFGTPLNLASVAHQASLIKERPSVKDYFEKQLLKYKSIGKKSSRRKHRKSGDRRKHRKSDGRRKHRKSGGRRKRRDFESSDEESSEESSEESDDSSDEESGYKSNRKSTFSMRRASSKFIARFGSSFQRSRRGGPSN
ncbi:hypothetical protein MT418_004135 [Batrachochytrium dendrobatidis]